MTGRKLPNHFLAAKLDDAATFEIANLFIYRVQAKEQFMQFSKEPTMQNFGALPFGTIPEPLRAVRPFRK